jgi:hypothetical protein
MTTIPTGCHNRQAARTVRHAAAGSPPRATLLPVPSLASSRFVARARFDPRARFGIGSRARASAYPRRALAVLVTVGALTACGNDEGASAERFCGEIAANKDALTAPSLEFSDDVEPLLDLYREIGDLAPLGIEQEWRQLVTAYETASTMVLDDPASEQAAVAAIYSSEESAAKVDAWLRANCAVDLGPIVTLVPHDQ